MIDTPKNPPPDTANPHRTLEPGLISDLNIPDEDH